MALDNPPLPPSDADNGMGEPPMEGPDGSEPPMDEPPMDQGDEPKADGDDQELMDIINSMSVEDKAAVMKYAKSIADDNGGDEPSDEPIGSEPPMDQEPPKVESRMSRIDAIIDEAIMEAAGQEDSRKRNDKRMPKEYEGMESPFKSPFK